MLAFLFDCSLVAVPSLVALGPLLLVEQSLVVFLVLLLLFVLLFYALYLPSIYPASGTLVVHKRRR